MRIDLEVVRRAHHDDQVIKLIAEAEVEAKAEVEAVAMTIARLRDRVKEEVPYSSSN